MDLASITEQQFTQPLRDAIITEDMVATKQLINSVSQEASITDGKQIVKVYAESYILGLRDGEQFKREPTIQDIESWLSAKGLDSTLNAHAVLNSIKENGTTWDQQGGSVELKAVINKENIQRVMDMAVKEATNKILNTKWQSL